MRFRSFCAVFVLFLIGGMGLEATAWSEMAPDVASGSRGQASLRPGPEVDFKFWGERIKLFMDQAHGVRQ
jgi:hypothetical protein